MRASVPKTKVPFANYHVPHSCVIHLSVLFAIFPRTNKLLSRLHSSNITVDINDFELRQTGLRIDKAPNSAA